MESPGRRDAPGSRRAHGGSMKLLAYIRSLVSTLFHRNHEESELDEELRSHIQRHADDLERSGLPRAEAERRARIAFGAYEKAKEECRDTRGTTYIENCWQDLRFGV